MGQLSEHERMEGVGGVGDRRKVGRPRKEPDHLSAIQQERLATLEMFAIWRGQVRRRDLMRAFDLSDGQVTQTIGLYRRLAPSNLEVDPDTRAWRPSPRFSPRFIKGDTSEYLRKVFASRVAQIGGAALACDVPTTILPTLPANLPKEVVGLVVSSILARQGLEIHYQSLDTAEPTARTVWPHALVHTGYRWLVRCFDGRHGRFADLALARILAAGQSDLQSPVSLDQDQAWATMCSVRLHPATHLSVGQKEIVCREYGAAADEEICVHVRASMVQYFLDFYGLRPGDPGQKTMLEVANFNEVSVYDRGD